MSVFLLSCGENFRLIFVVPCHGVWGIVYFMAQATDGLDECGCNFGAIGMVNVISEGVAVE